MIVISRDSNFQWANLLNPEILRDNLVFASVYIALYEMLEDIVIEKAKDFYLSGLKNGKFIYRNYESEVLSKDKRIVKASLLWWKEVGAIDDNDIALFEKIKYVRNRLTHELTTVICEGVPNETVLLFSELIHLINKIEKWWLLEVEIPTSCDYLPNEIEDVISSNMILADIITNVELFNSNERYREVCENIGIKIKKQEDLK